MAPDLPSVLSSTRTLRLLLLLLLPSSLLIHQLAISRRRHGIRQCSHGRNAIQMPFPCRFYVPVLRASRRGAEGEGRCGGVEQRSLLIAAPILEHGRPEMEKSCREWTSRLLASVSVLVGRVEPGQAGTVFVSPGRPRSCPRGSSCKAPFPRFPATEAVDKSAPRAATTLEFECERICRQHGVNTGPSHRRKWPYNLSPSGRGAINRAALSANELLLPLPLPYPERES